MKHPEILSDKAFRAASNRSNKVSEKGIKRMRSEHSAAIKNQNQQAVQLSELVKKCIREEGKAKEIISAAKKEAKEIISAAQGRENKAVSQEADLLSKQRAADDSKKRSDDLIKSNRGKEKSLLKEKESVIDKKVKLARILGMIKDVA